MKHCLITLMLGISGLLPLGLATASESQKIAETAVVETQIAVNVNTAEAQELATLLSGVGSKKAQSIVLYREEHGVFKNADDLLNVKGIGPAILKKNKDRIKY